MNNRSPLLGIIRNSPRNGASERCPEAIERSNYRRHLCGYVICAIALNFASFSFMQTFLSEAGLSSSRIGIVSSVIQVAGGAGLFVLSGFVDAIRNPVGVMMGSTFGYALLPATLILLSFLIGYGLSPGALFVCAVAAAFAGYFISSIRSVLESVVYCVTISQANRSRLFSRGGTAYNLTALPLGIVSACIIRLGGFPKGFAILFSLSAGLSCLSSICLKGLTVLPKSRADSAPRGFRNPVTALCLTLKKPVFTHILIPNITRGFVSGIVLSYMMIGITRYHFEAEYAAHVMTAGIVGAMIASFSLKRMYQRLGVPRTCFVSSFVMAAGFAAVLLCGKPVFFIILYAPVMFGEYMIGVMVPLGVMDSVNADILGAYSSARLLLFQISVAAAMYFSGILLDRELWAVLPVSACLLSVCTGAMYYSGFMRMQKGAGTVFEDGGEHASANVTIPSRRSVWACAKQFYGDFKRKKQYTIAVSTKNK